MIKKKKKKKKNKKKKIRIVYFHFKQLPKSLTL